MSDFIVAFGIPLAYIALGIAALSAVAFPLIQMFQDLKKAKMTFIGVGALVVVFLLGYMLAENQPLTVGDITVSAGQMRMVEASIYCFYILLAVSVLAIIYSSVSRYFK